MEAFYDRYSVLCFSLAVRMLGERQAAEDVVQEAFVNAWRAAETFDPRRSSARSWLLSIVRNRCVDKLRAGGSRPKFAVEAEIDERPGSQDVWREVSDGLTSDRVRGALTELPAEQKETIELAYFGGLTQMEIAERMNVPLGTVKGRIRIGLGRLRGLLAGMEPDLLA